MIGKIPSRLCETFALIILYCDSILQLRLVSRSCCFMITKLQVLLLLVLVPGHNVGKTALLLGLLMTSGKNQLTDFLWNLAPPK